MRKLFFLFALLLLIAACGEPPECEKSSDCSAGTCEIASCVEGVCQVDIEPNCCGNGQKDATENGKPGNSCTCPTDYGPCALESAYADYADILMASCNAQEVCETRVNITSEPASFSQDISASGRYQLAVKFAFTKPFDAKKDLFRLSIDPIMIADDISQIELTHFKLMGTQAGKSPEVLIDENLNYVIKNVDSDVDVGLVLEPASSAVAVEYARLEGSLVWNYVQKGKTTSVTTPFKNVLVSRDTLRVVKPPIDYLESDCPDCDDGNAATRDVCPTGRAYCLHTFLPNTCGNFQCETGENMCTCPHDCGSCSGAYLFSNGQASSVLERACTASICELKIKDTPRVVSKVNTANTDSMTYLTEISAKEPFDVRTDKLTFKVKLQQKTNGDILYPIKIIDVLITDRDDKKIANVPYTADNEINAINEQWSAEYAASTYVLDDRDVDTDVKYEIRLEYVKLNAKSEPVTTYATLRGTFSKWKFVEPGTLK